MARYQTYYWVAIFLCQLWPSCFVKKLNTLNTPLADNEMPLEINIKDVVDQTISEICAWFFSAVVSGAACYPPMFGCAVCDPDDVTQCIASKFAAIFSGVLLVVAVLLVEAGWGRWWCDGGYNNY